MRAVELGMVKAGDAVVGFVDQRDKKPAAVVEAVEETTEIRERQLPRRQVSGPTRAGSANQSAMA